MMIRKKRVFKKRFRIKKKKPFFKKKIFWASFFLFLTTAILFYFFIFADVFQVKEIKIEGNQKVSEEDLRMIVEAGAEKKIIHLTKNIFLVNPRKIERTILDKFPQIAEVKLRKKFPHILILEVKERIPLILFCRDSNDCFQIDKEGVAFEKIGWSERPAIFSPGGEISLGQSVIPIDYLEAILEIEKKLGDELEIEVKKFLLLDDKLNVETVQGPEIYFDPKGRVSEQLFNLAVLLKEKISSEKRGELEYIDLRFGNRVYYK